MRKLPPEEVLCYRNLKSRRGAIVRRCYEDFRRSQGIPIRCDNEKCMFFEQPLVWNGSPLPLILDHRNGVSTDDRPRNLRFLCPNCNSQQDTHGGKNKGRVERAEGGFAIRRRKD